MLFEISKFPKSLFTIFWLQHDKKINDNKHKNIYIPLDPANTDYQEYLKWLSDGNTPEEAEWA